MRTKFTYLQRLLIVIAITSLSSIPAISKNVQGLLIDSHWIVAVADSPDASDLYKLRTIEYIYNGHNGKISCPCSVDEKITCPIRTHHTIALLHVSSPLLKIPIFRSIKNEELQNKITKAAKIPRVILPPIANQEMIFSEDVITWINSKIIADACRSGSFQGDQKTAGQPPSQNKRNSHRRRSSDSDDTLHVNNKRGGLALQRSNSDNAIITPLNSRQLVTRQDSKILLLENIASQIDELTGQLKDCLETVGSDTSPSPRIIDYGLLKKHEDSREETYKIHCQLVNILDHNTISVKESGENHEDFEAAKLKISRKLEEYYNVLTKFPRQKYLSKIKEIIEDAKDGKISQSSCAQKILCHLQLSDSGRYSSKAVDVLKTYYHLNALPAFRIAIYYQYRAFVHQEIPTMWTSNKELPLTSVSSKTLGDFFKNLVCYEDFVLFDRYRKAVIQTLKEIRDTEEERGTKDSRETKEFFKSFRKNFKKYYQKEDLDRLLLYLDSRDQKKNPLGKIKTTLATTLGKTRKKKENKPLPVGSYTTPD